MLVLSRREKQKICFPELDITVEILRVKGSAVRVGVEAPIEIKVLRDEIKDPWSYQNRADQQVVRFPKAERHAMRNKLNTISLALHLYKKQIEAGQIEEAEKSFQGVFEHLQEVMSSQVSAPASAAPNPSSDRTALVVEDEPNEREMLAGLLRMHGYEVVTACDGIQAMEYLRTNDQPSLMLIDMRMPLCDGPTTIRHIRRNPEFAGLKIFAISGSSPEENRLGDLDEGVNQWFMKPLDPQNLVTAMADTLQEETTAA